MSSIGEIPGRAAAATPDKVAIVDDLTSVTYAELEAGSDALAVRLRERGLAPGDRVGLLLTNSSRFMLAYFATAKAGGVIVPINPRLSTAEIQFLVDHTECAAFFHDQGFGAKVAALRLPRIRIAVGAERDGDELMEDVVAREVDLDLARPAEGDLAAIFYTSGTTADPKGVEMTHRTILQTVEILGGSFDVGADDVGLCPIPLTHTTVHFTPVPVIAAGGTIVLCDRFRPASALDLLERHRVSLLPTVTAVAVLMAKELVASERRYDLGPLRKIFVGGANVPASLVDAWHEIAPNCSAVNCYGMTEMDGPISRMDRHRFPLRRGSVGKSYPGVEVRIETEAGDAAATGEVGEIVVRGGNMMAGYWRNPRATAAALVDGRLHTGDLGYLDEDGYLFVVGRKKNVLKRGGELVYPDEVENVLLANPAVKEAVVVAVGDEVMGERVAVVVARQPGAAIGVDELIAFCGEHLADFKVPEYVGFVEDELPKNTVGKVDRRGIATTVTGGAIELADRRRGSVRSRR
ncbi:MAG TPA: AMP-binding protein [Solirubrobacterales bacterium]|nr:AMP-binding protein [Solirubrobacterales bacterium]